MSSLLSSLEIPIRWTDLDGYGHVGNQHYFEYMTEARAVFLKDHMKNLSQYLFVLIDARCNFKKQVFYPTTLLLKQYLLKIGNSSFELQYVFESVTESGVVYAEGYAKMVCVDPNTQRAMPVPDAVKMLLNSRGS